MFHREGLYDEDGHPYPDNDRRFILFSKAALWAAETHLAPDLYHCHDWFTGALPFLVKHDDRSPERPTVYTIHNLKHQGRFPSDSYRYLECDWDDFRFDTLEHHGQLNLMKGGIAAADRVTTVSPTYAEEIQTGVFGEGLKDTLSHHSEKLSGILNGIDTNTWDPSQDEHLDEEERFEPEDLSGKKRVKQDLLNQFPESDGTEEPLVGMVGRLVDQKGIDLVLDAWEKIRKLPGRWIVLGTGDEALERRLSELSERDPNKIQALITFSETMAHRIEAGSDLFCMPSRYEPCGLNQMYSMRYGTVPVVHATGGLADTVVDPEDNTDQATGFTFEDPNSEALVGTLQRALDCYQSDRDRWCRIQSNGMERDWSWSKSSRRYEKLYEEVLS
jgi:starch synthase